MALTIGEASDLNDVLAYVLGIPDPPGFERPDAERHELAGEAAARLADKAYGRLHAGLNGRHVREQWPNVELGPWQDEATP